MAGGPSPTYIPVVRQGADMSFNTIAVTGAATVGGALTVTGAVVLNGGGAWAGLMDAAGGTAATRVFGALVTGDTVDRFSIRADGRHDWGPGAAGVRDAGVFRTGVATLATDSTWVLSVAGNGLQIKEGANATMGLATMVAGTVTVNTTKVTANSRVQLTVQSLGTVTSPKPVGVTARVAGTSFTITSGDATDTSTVAWTILEPAP